MRNWVIAVSDEVGLPPDEADKKLDGVLRAEISIAYGSPLSKEEDTGKIAGLENVEVLQNSEEAGN